MIATGVWKAKKHKDAAPLAQRAWKRLKAWKVASGCGFSMHDAGRGHPRDGHWVKAARGLALEGKRGTYIYAADVS